VNDQSNAGQPSTAGASHTESARLRPAVVITGASEGIGLALAFRFAHGTGNPVLMIARRADVLSAAAQQVTARHGTPAIPLALDVTAPGAADVIEQTLAAHGLYAGIFINNAGIGLGGDFTDHTEAGIAQLIDVNVRAVSLLTRRFLPAMLERGSGGVINIASLGGFAPGPYQAAYYASKAYVLSLTRALAFETRGRGVHMCVVTPGPVETRFHERMGADEAFYRYAMRAMSTEAIARATWRGWKLGFRVIQPGLLTPGVSILMRVTPWLLLVPIIGWLLRQRYQDKVSSIP
jgi:short-subunit dehydrogenase